MNALDFIDGIAAFAHPDERVLYEFVQDRLSDIDREAVDKHLSRCDHCRELAELFGRSNVPGQQPTKTVLLPVGGDPVKLASAEIAPAPSRSSRSVSPSRAPWIQAEIETLAAADSFASANGSEPAASKAGLVRFIPGATDGDAALGYLCAGSVDVVVTGAEDRPVKVLLDETEYEVLNGVPDEPRVVVGLTRRDVAIWLAGKSDRVFRVLYL